MKPCLKCGKPWPLSNYHRRSNGKLFGQCKRCMSIQRAAKYQRTKDAISVAYRVKRDAAGGLTREQYLAKVRGPNWRPASGA